MRDERAEWVLGPNVPQVSGRALRWFGSLMMRLSGWRFDGSMPDLSRFVIIVAPHTSNWDFIYALFAKWALGIRIRFLGKDTLFIPPLGWFMRAIGGIPVDRTQRNNLVEESIREFAARDQFVLVLAPEGTRKRVTQWRSGFWHIARAADVPICCVALDYATRRIRLGPTSPANDADAEAGVNRFRSYFSDVQGYDPSLQG